jgi:hypothetical protein
MRSILLLAVALLAVSTATAAPTRICARDRAEGTLAEAGAEAGFCFHGLAGSEIRISVKATDGSTLEPEIILANPDDVLVDIVNYIKHAEGSRKTKLRTFLLPETGRYTIVVRGLSGTTGTYRMKVKAEHVLKYKDEGKIQFGFDSGLPRFSALEGALLTFKVKGRNAFQPQVRTLLQPDVHEVNIPGVVAEGRKVKGSTYYCNETGEYRLRIESASGLPGEWKSKIKLSYPSPERRTHVVDGEPAGTYTDDFEEPGSIPSLPLRAIDDTTEFRVILSILDPKPDQTWTSGESMALMVTLQNRTTGNLTVGFTSTPWENIVVRDLGSSDIVWRMNPVTMPFAKQETFPWGDSRSWSTTWDTRNQSGGALAPGDYLIVATFATFDARMPQEAWLHITIE